MDGGFLEGNCRGSRHMGGNDILKGSYPSSRHMEDYCPGSQKCHRNNRLKKFENVITFQRVEGLQPKLLKNYGKIRIIIFAIQLMSYCLQKCSKNLTCFRSRRRTFRWSFGYG